MKIMYSKQALKFLSKQEKRAADRIRNGIAGLTQSPPVGDIAPMQGNENGDMRLRVGTFRVIFNYGDETGMKILLILKIGNRGDIYK